MASPSNRTLFVPASPFAGLASQIAARQKVGLPIVPLHVGDTYREPPVSVTSTIEEGVNRYSPPGGDPAFVNALQARLGRRTLPTAGATGGVSLAIQATTMPHSRMLVLAPYWPLVRGIARANSVQVTEVDSYGTDDQLRANLLEIESLLLCPEVSAVYVSSPSNPTGRVLPEWFLSTVVALCGRRDKWVISDETYEDYLYEGRHYSPRLAGDNVVTVHSFSKAYGLAGYRVGYITGPDDVLGAAQTLATHTWYSVSTVGQRVAGAALDNGSWISLAKESYRTTGRAAAKAFGLPDPEGSQFLWVPISRPMEEFLRDALDHGILVTPGSAFGSGYSKYVRVSYTAASPDAVLQAVNILASLR